MLPRNKVKNNFLIKYIYIGFINTLFGYFIGIVNFKIFYDLTGIIIVSIINNLVAITFSFFTYKLYVFKTSKKFWIKEYFKVYIVYFFIFIINTLILWVCIELIFLNIYYSQGLSLFATVIFSYHLNKNYTFKNG